MPVDAVLLKQAKLVRQYASETGKLAPELANAIARAETSTGAAQDAAAIEAEILRAQSDAIRTMGISNISIIETWYSEKERRYSGVSKGVAAVFLLVSLLCVIVFTF